MWGVPSVTRVHAEAEPRARFRHHRTKMSSLMAHPSRRKGHRFEREIVQEALAVVPYDTLLELLTEARG